MVQQATKTAQTPVTSKRVNVTNLTQNQKRNIIANYFEQAGFVGLVKKKVGEQTYYTFSYKTS